MLFNSFPFMFALLPASLVVFLLSFRFGPRGPMAAIILSSLVFYGWWKVEYLPLLIGSVVVNYLLGVRITPQKGRALMIVGIVLNLGLLGWYKYAAFIADNINAVAGTTLGPLAIVLPLGISFFTFQQVAFLVDRRRGVITEVDPYRYAAFVTYFPQLIAGPIVHYNDVDGQYRRLQAGERANIARAIEIGLFLFAIGLFKKSVLADGFAAYASPVFDKPQDASALLVWRAALSYTFQIYFDFSGYVDMALGAARMFGITLPENFNSPYKARSIVDFWRRWHITLSHFLRDYLYIALGGNRHGAVRRYVNLAITMVLGGLWHGASWAFVLWGALHGLMLVFNHLMDRLFPRVKLFAFLAVPLTFLAVVIVWVPFRAETIETTLLLWGKMADAGAIVSEAAAALTALASVNVADPALWIYDQKGLSWCVAAILTLAALWFLPNSSTMTRRFEEEQSAGKPLLGRMILAGAAFGLAVLLIRSGQISEFLYFQF